MVELTQEFVSVGVLLLVCVSLSVSCLILWMVRCRRDQLRRKEGKDDRQRDLENFEDNMRRTQISPQTKRKIHDSKKEAGKKAETDVEKAKRDEKNGGKSKEKRGTGTVARTDETMQQFEARMKLETISETETPARNKRLDTVSIIATGSSETLQRNDSKVNVFPAERVDEMDLNPGLNGSINLDAI